LSSAREIDFVVRARSAGRRAQVDAVTAEVFTALRAQGVTPILLKGPTFTAWLYGDKGGRAYVDTDVLVSSDQLRTAEHCLSRLGFEKPVDPGMPGAEEPGQQWIRGDGGQVDLHTSLPGARVSPAEAWTLLARQTDSVRVGGMDVAALSEPARALHVALHAAHHGTRIPQPIEDLARAAERVPRSTWAQAASLAQQLGATHSLAAGLRLHPEGVVLADGLQLPSRLPVEVELLAGEKPAGALTLEAIAKAPGLRAKMQLIARKVVPPPSFMRVWFPRAAAGRRFGLTCAYLYRPVWLLRKAGPAWQTWRSARSQSKRGY
jgi:hypothetical protein